jgi:Aspartyl/Asparaginyl beta-hydroxylase
MATSREEIERQRVEAFQLVENDNNPLQFSSNINHGEIPLEYKRYPVPELIKKFKIEQLSQKENISIIHTVSSFCIDDRNPSNHNDTMNSINDNLEAKSSSHDDDDDELQIVHEFQQQTSFFPCWSSRGYADVSKLQDLVREGYNLKYTMKKANSQGNSTNTTISKNQQQQSSSTIKNSSIKNRIPYTVSDIQSTTNYWDPANASINNVSICRPSHDAWGIGKIILIFCDDFLQSIYTLPWLESFQEAITPILTVLNIPLNRIVRMLLASLPPGGTIPIHTDSGEWVQHTHRIHCPILVDDSNKIIFQCGISQQTLSNIHCNPGHVFEINNQAYHFVCNASSEHRVHLILDYIDDISLPISIRPPIQLQSGEIVVQTRRSIDRLIDAGTRQTPTFFILGAQKAGTTTLYEALVQHPLIINAKRRETHCFDWRWNTSLKSINEHRQYITNTFYFANDLHYHPACLTGDSTPSYLIDSKRVITRLRAVCNDWLDELKFFIMIREPIQRLESHYAMVTSNIGTPEQIKTRGYEWRDNTKTIVDIINDDIQKMKDCGLLPYWNTNTPGNEFNQSLFDQFSGSDEEDKAWDLYLSKHIPLNTGSYGLVSRGLYEMNMRPWIQTFSGNIVDGTTPSSTTVIQSSSLPPPHQQQQVQQFCIIRLEDMKNDGIQCTMNELVWEHLNIPKTTINDTTPKNVRDYSSVLDDSTTQYLQRFYQPHNNRLVQFIEANSSLIKFHSEHFQQWKENGSCWMYA